MQSEQPTADPPWPPTQGGLCRIGPHSGRGSVVVLRSPASARPTAPSFTSAAPSSARWRGHAAFCLFAPNRPGNLFCPQQANRTDGAALLSRVPKLACPLCSPLQHQSWFVDTDGPLRGTNLDQNQKRQNGSSVEVQRFSSKQGREVHAGSPASVLHQGAQEE